MIMSDFYKKILDNNKKWVENKLAISPEYFKNLADGQNPPLLWIGCSDSRVPANEINAIRIWSVKKITSHLQAQKKEKLH